MRTSPKRLLTAIAKWLLTLAMLTYALREIDSHDMRRMLLEQDMLIAAGVVLLFILQLFISTFRWQRVIALLAQHTPGIALLTRLNFISIFFNNVLPGTIGGDVVRAMMLKSPARPLSLCIHSVIIDRLVAVIGIVIMVAGALPWLSAYVPLPPIATMFAGFAALALVGLVLLAKATDLLAPFHHVALVKLLAEFLSNMRRVVFAPRAFLIMLAQAVLAHGCFCLAAYMLAVGLGAPLSFAGSLILIPPVLLLMMLPISVGGWGVRELSMVAFLGYAGVSNEAALAISVQLGVLIMIASLPGAYIYARRKKE